MTRHRVAIVAMLLIAAAIVGVSYYFYGKEYVYRFTEAQLRQALSKRLPFTKSYLLIFEITLDHAHITLVNAK